MGERDGTIPVQYSASQDGNSSVGKSSRMPQYCAVHQSTYIYWRVSSFTLRCEYTRGILGRQETFWVNTGRSRITWADNIGACPDIEGRSRMSRGRSGRTKEGALGILGLLSEITDIIGRAQTKGGA